MHDTNLQLSKSAKITWELKHEAFKTIYKGAIVPILLYGAPVWTEAMKYAHNRLKYIRVQRFMNMVMAKAFLITSSETLCIVTRITPIIIRTEEAVKQYNIRKGKGSQTLVIDRKVEIKNWTHPADVVKIIEDKGFRDKTVQIYTDGSKNEHGVSSGAAILVGKELKAQIKFKLDNRCSNNQAEQFTMAKALESIDKINIAENSPCTIGIFTDSRINIDSLKNVNNHCYLIEDIRKRISGLESNKWTIEFSWVKVHVEYTAIK